MVVEALASLPDLPLPEDGLPRLEARLAFWVSLGIPISFLGSLLILPLIGVTFNMVSMFAFIITLGIVVDDAGEVFVAGYTTKVSADNDILVVKYKKDNGTQLWVASFNGEAGKDDKSVGIGMSPDGHVLVGRSRTESDRHGHRCQRKCRV